MDGKRVLSSFTRGQCLRNFCCDSCLEEEEEEKGEKEEREERRKLKPGNEQKTSSKHLHKKRMLQIYRKNRKKKGKRKH